MKKEEVQFATGALTNPYDHRDISVSAFEALGTSRPKKVILDLSQITPKDQKRNGSCVGHAESTTVEFNEVQDLKVATPLSPRDLYAECKRRDGLASEGTYPRVAGLVIVDRGIASLKEVPNDCNLSHKDYINTKSATETAIFSRQKGFAGVPINYAFIADQIAKGRIVAFSMPTDGANMRSTPMKPSKTTIGGWHRVAFYGYEDINDNDGILYMVNSWGDSFGFKVKGLGGYHGCNTMVFSEWQTLLTDLQVYTDIPTALIKKAKEAGKDFYHVFNTDLKQGMRSAEVTALQKALLNSQDYYSAFYGDYLDTGFFGTVTLASVKRFQARHGIPNTGYVGKMTRAKLNELYGQKKT